ncbi:hypothetical protein ACQEU8_21865 [Streptomyces sp. CA-250714]
MKVKGQTAMLIRLPIEAGTEDIAYSPPCRTGTGLDLSPDA